MAKIKSCKYSIWSDKSGKVFLLVVQVNNSYIFLKNNIILFDVCPVGTTDISFRSDK